MNNWISVGVPCGAMDDTDNRVVIRRNRLFLLSKTGYDLWKQFMNGASVESVMQSFDFSDPSEKQVGENCLEDFRKTGLIVELKNAIHQLPIRQGIGLGFEKESGKYIIKCGKEITVPFLCYMIWCYADGQSSVIEIRDRLRAIDLDVNNEVFINAFYQLLKTEALLLN